VNCPTRRQAIIYSNPGQSYQNANTTNQIFESDYAANTGDQYLAFANWVNTPGSEAEANTWNANWGNPDPSKCGWGFISTDMTASLRPTGIVYQVSEVTTAMITDGVSNTYLVGEKYVSADNYYTGQDTSDTEGAFAGDDNDNQRVSYAPPALDGVYTVMSITGTTEKWGSAHDSGLNMAFCDGSVHAISYSINSVVPVYDANGKVTTEGIHQRLGNRADGFQIDASSF